MDKGQELLQEEQLDTLKTLVTEINGLKEALTNELVVKQTNNPDKLEVSGTVKVNTEKEVAITNIEDFTSGLDALGDKLYTIIKESSHKPLDSVTIKNIEQAIAKEIKVSNLSELTRELQAVKQAILDSDKQPIVNVEKQEVVFPTDPKKPMAVRLSDGKSFYTAMTAAVSSGINTQNLATTAKQDEIIAAIASISGGSSSPLAVYSYIQKDTSGATYKYYGYADANTAGGWAIKRITIATNLAEFITGASDYSTAWGDRATQTYADIWSTF